MLSLRTTDLRCQADVLHVLSGLHHYLVKYYQINNCKIIMKLTGRAAD
jgi:hypothetical protein